MDYLSIIFAITMVVITIVLAVVGVYLVMVLTEARRTLRKVNDTLDVMEEKVTAFTQPLMRLGGMTTGLATGFKVFETFVSWLQRHKPESDRG